MPDEKISAMTVLTGLVYGNTTLPAIRPGVSTNYSLEADQIVMVAPKAQHIVLTGSGTTVVDLALGTRISFTTSGGGAGEVVKIKNPTASLPYQYYNYGNIIVNCYVKTATAHGDYVLLETSGGQPFKIYNGKGGNPLFTGSQVKPYVSQYATAAFVWTGDGNLQFSGRLSFNVATHSQYFGVDQSWQPPSSNSSGQGVNISLVAGDNGGSGSGGDFTIGGGAGTAHAGNVIIKNYRTVDPGVSGALWRDPATGIVHMHP